MFIINSPLSQFEVTNLFGIFAPIFGQFGEVTLNQIGVALKDNLKDINRESLYDRTRLTVQGLPVASNVIGYSLILKSYMKYVHNRPLDQGINTVQNNQQKMLRNRQLVLFCILGAPLTLFFLKSTTIALKDMFTLTIGGASQVENNNSNLINSSFLVFFSNLNNKIPKWFKILFRLLFLTIILLKILGFSIISVFSINYYTFKIIYYIIFSLIISFHLITLYLLHKFSNKNIKISKVLPEFVINWLKMIEIMSTSKAGIRELKTNCYIEITVYLLLMLLTIITAKIL